MTEMRWDRIPLDVPSLLPLQAAPETQEQVIPYIKGLHNYLRDDRIKIARAIQVMSFFRQFVGDAADLQEPIGSQNIYLEEDTQILKFDSRAAALAGTPEWQTIVSGDTLHADSDVVELVHGTGSTYDDLQDFINQTQSSGAISGFTLSDAGSYQVAIAAGTCLLADSDDPNNRVIGFYDYAGETTAAIADGETKHILIEYNGGSPAYAFHASADLDQKDAFTLGWVTREGTTLHITNAPARVNELPHNVVHYLREVLGFTRANALGGIILGNTGTRNPTLSAGEIYYGLNEFGIDAVDCSGADTFTRYYRVAGTWTSQAGLTQWPNNTYTDGTNLQTMTVNRYGCLWFYVDLEDGNLIMLYGTSNAASQTTAEAEAPPATVPPRVANGCVLVGRYVFQNGASTPALVQSAFNSAFNPSGTTDHTQLSNIGTKTHAQLETELDSTIHDNVSGEINALTWVEPQYADVMLIEDASASYAKKKTNIADLGKAVITPIRVDENQNTYQRYWKGVTGDYDQGAAAGALVIRPWGNAAAGGNVMFNFLLRSHTHAPSKGFSELHVSGYDTTATNWNGGSNYSSRAELVSGTTFGSLSNRVRLGQDGNGYPVVVIGETTDSHSHFHWNLDVHANYVGATAFDPNDVTYEYATSLTGYTFAIDHNPITTSFLSDATGQINALTSKATPASSDVILIEDSAASWAKKKVAISALSGGGEVPYTIGSNGGSVLPNPSVTVYQYWTVIDTGTGHAGYLSKLYNSGISSAAARWTKTKVTVDGTVLFEFTAAAYYVDSGETAIGLGSVINMVGPIFFSDSLKVEVYSYANNAYSKADVAWTEW